MVFSATLDWWGRVNGWLSGHGWHTIFTQSVTIALITLVALITVPAVVGTALKWLWYLFPLWGPLFATPLFWAIWWRYSQTIFLSKQEHVILEIKLPKELKQTPEAMERVFTSFFLRSGQTTFITRLLKGGIGTWWSFEIHSYEGKLHFYVWGRKKFKEMMKSFIYAQYPHVDVVEIYDPYAGLKFLPNKMNVWGVEYGLSKDDVIPIKTYTDYHLEDMQSGKNIEKYSDPLESVFERLSDLRKGEQAILQFVIRQDRDKQRGPKPLFWFPTGGKWTDRAKAKIKEIYSNARLEYENVMTGEIEKGFAQLKPAEAELVKALTRSIEKHQYNAVIRFTHFGRPGAYRGHINSTHFTQMWRHFASGKFNGIGTNWTYWHEHIDFPWQDWLNYKGPKYNREILDAFRRRQAFYVPYEHIYSTYTVEELATLYHFPNINSQAPGVVRIQSRTSDAPKNLPTA